MTSIYNRLGYLKSMVNDLHALYDSILWVEREMEAQRCYVKLVPGPGEDDQLPEYAAQDMIDRIETLVDMQQFLSSTRARLIREGEELAKMLQREAGQVETEFFSKRSPK